MSDVKKNVGADGRTLTEYQYNEAIEGAKEYFKGDDLATSSRNRPNRCTGASPTSLPASRTLTPIR